ncbi:hypothetical protein HMPREF1981_00883 [Bacteroides pyogenes F0041]|uniref:Uncharacterized protein n=1 Tax=Bacteroides pyogenes F0041 TaxID=1321819 RepID=U2CR11_9BACE|nr:hypothetical protein HMPREF1981_00883 [Bacteroides pyogenes F0041]
MRKALPYDTILNSYMDLNKNSGGIRAGAMKANPFAGEPHAGKR